MKILLFLFMLGSCYYTFTYGRNLWEKQNKLGGSAVMLLAVLATLIPAFVLFIK